MTYTEFYKIVNDICDQIDKDESYEYIGVRFENKLRAVGEICECSNHNDARDDERDFPEYGSAEYAEMQELDGTSAWLAHCTWNYREDVSTKAAFRKPSWQEDDEMRGQNDHAYVVAGNRLATPSDADHGEIVIVDAIVLKVLY